MRARILQSWMKLLAPSLLATLLVTGAAWAEPQPDVPAAVPAPATATAPDDAGKPCDDHDRGGRPGPHHGGKPCCEGDEADGGDDEPCEQGGCPHEGKPCGDCDRPGMGMRDGMHGKPCCGDCEHGKPCGDCERGKPCSGGCEHGKPCCGEGMHGKPCCGDCERARGRKGPFGRGPVGLAGLPIRPEALLQFQAAYPFGGEASRKHQLVAGDRAERPGFAMRTARLGLSGKLGPHARFVIDTDLVKIQNVPLTQAFVGVSTWRGSELLLGAHKMPFSRFAISGSGEQALAERPFAVQAMAPFYQLGATLTGHYPQLAGLRWYAGAYNSFERRTNFFQGVQENSGLTGNRFGGLAYAGRIQLEPFGNLGRPVADIDHGRFKFEVGGGMVYNDSGTTTSQAMSLDLHVKFRGAHLLVEFLQDWANPKQEPQTPVTIPARLQRRAMIAELGYVFHHLNLAARVEKIDPNLDVEDSRDELVLSGAVGVQAMRNRARVQLQFDHRDESQSSIKNDTLFAQFQWML